MSTYSDANWYFSLLSYSFDNLRYFIWISIVSAKVGRKATRRRIIFFVLQLSIKESRKMYLCYICDCSKYYLKKYWIITFFHKKWVGARKTLIRGFNQIDLLLLHSALSWIFSLAESLTSSSLQYGATKWYYSLKNHILTHPPTLHPLATMWIFLIYYTPEFLVSLGCMLGFRGLYEKYLEVVMRVSGRYLESVWNVSGSGLDGWGFHHSCMELSCSHKLKISVYLSICASVIFVG